MAGGYAAIFLSSLVPIPFLLLLPVVALVTFVLGVAVALVAYFPLMRRPPATVFISTLLCGMVLQNLFLVAFGPEAKSGPALAGSGMMHFAGLELSRQAAGTIVVAALVIEIGRAHV